MPVDNDDEQITQSSITCLTCLRTSYHPTDVEKKYCGHCKRFMNPGEYIVRDCVNIPIDRKAFNEIRKVMKSLTKYDSQAMDKIWKDTEQKLVSQGRLPKNG